VPENGAYEGQFIAAGYSGHGMPRAYAWLVFTGAPFNLIALIIVLSAEVVARMITAKLYDSPQWEIPEWLPRHYLTVERTNTKPLTRQQAVESRESSLAGASG